MKEIIGFIILALLLGGIATYFCFAVGRKRNTGSNHGGGIDSAPSGIEGGADHF